MDEVLSKYDESLQALEKQRESLELVIQRMGAEWEESGAGIGWMGDIQFNSSVTRPNISTPPRLHMEQSVHSHAQSSHDYRQTVLNANDDIVARSLVTSSPDNRVDYIRDNLTHNIASVTEPQEQALVSPPLTEANVVNHNTTANLISQSILRTQQQENLHPFCSPSITPKEE